MGSGVVGEVGSTFKVCEIGILMLLGIEVGWIFRACWILCREETRVENAIGAKALSGIKTVDIGDT